MRWKPMSRQDWIDNIKAAVYGTEEKVALGRERGLMTNSEFNELVRARSEIATIVHELEQNK